MNTNFPHSLNSMILAGFSANIQGLKFFSWQPPNTLGSKFTNLVPFKLRYKITLSSFQCIADAALFQPPEGGKWYGVTYNLSLIYFKV